MTLFYLRFLRPTEACGWHYPLTVTTAAVALLITPYAIGLPFILAIIGLPPIFGGIYALKKKNRQRAFILSLFAAPLWGIGVLTALLIYSARDEFT